MRVYKKIKLIIFPGNFLPNVGGLETHVAEFAKYLNLTNKYEILIFTPKNESFKNSKSFQRIYSNVKVIRYPSLEIVSNYLIPKFWTFKFWKLFFSLYNMNFDIVMTRTRFFTNSTLGLFFAKFRFKKIKLIHVEHGSDFVKLNSYFKSFIALIYDKIFGKLLFFLADKNIAISKVCYNFIIKEFVKKKEDVPIIWRGVDFSLYKNIKSDSYFKKKYKNKILIGTLCRLYKWKGVKNAICAFMDLDEKIKSKCIYFVVGDGEEFARLKNFAKSEKNIIFLGLVDFDKAISLFKIFDIFIHSSYPGGALSNSILQAMYCKCAIIASPNEGANEVIFNNKNGFLLKDNLPTSINSYLIKLIENKDLREKFGFNSYNFIKENFSWQKVIKLYEKVFLEVLNNK